MGMLTPRPRSGARHFQLPAVDQGSRDGPRLLLEENSDEVQVFLATASRTALHARLLSHRADDAPKRRAEVMPLALSALNTSFVALLLPHAKR